MTIVLTDKGLPIPGRHLWTREKYERATELGLLSPDDRVEMQSVGKDFKAPRQQNIKQWRKVEMLLQRGYRWRQGAESRDVTEGKWKG